MTIHYGDNSHERAAAYYGKIPLAGDFITRRLQSPTIALWDNWLRQGLFEARHNMPNESASQRQTTIWNFVIPPAISGCRLIGLVIDSRDRVGRRYPFALFDTSSLYTNELLRFDEIAPFFMRHASIIRAAQQRQLSVDQLDSALQLACDWQPVRPIPKQANSIDSGDIYAILGAPADAQIHDDTTVSPPLGSLLPWPGVNLEEIMKGSTSYWWTNQTLGDPLRGFTHTGKLNEALFQTLFTSPIR